jgi:DNA-binding NarL/FixJ family response regulator
LTRTSVVILSGHTLFVEGVATRLGKQTDRVKLHVVDSAQEKALEQVASVRPGAVILDATDPDATRNCPLNRLFGPCRRCVIRLDPESNQIQVVTSESAQGGYHRVDRRHPTAGCDGRLG